MNNKTEGKQLQIYKKPIDWDREPMSLALFILLVIIKVEKINNNKPFKILVLIDKQSKESTIIDECNSLFLILNMDKRFLINRTKTKMWFIKKKDHKDHRFIEISEYIPKTSHADIIIQT